MAPSNEDVKSVSQEFLDTHQYSIDSILCYERIFGHTWVSTGGESTTKEFCMQLNLKPDQKVLDVGFGTGGSSFYMARQYGVHVTGVDLSTNMCAIANDRLNREEKSIQQKITFLLADIMEHDFPLNEFDVIYSRDVLIHIKDKEGLFKRMLPWLKSGGILLVSDYCRGDKKVSEEFTKYVKKRGYNLRTVEEYGNVIEQAGFKDVRANNKSQYFIDILKTELRHFQPTKESFIKEFNEDLYNEINDGWSEKIVRVEAGDHVWGLFVATKQ